MGFKDFFTKDYETSDNSNCNELTTHYYRNRIEDIYVALDKLIEDEKGSVTERNEDWQEILFETAGYSCTVTITSITPLENSIDFKISTYNLFGMGKGKKLIINFYSYLDKVLNLKGCALYKG